MKTKYKSIKFVYNEADGFWWCDNKQGIEICQIKKYEISGKEKWYSFNFADGREFNRIAVFPSVILREIADFIDQLNEGGKK